MVTQRRVEVFLRRSVPLQARARQLAVLGRLRALQTAGAVGGVTVDTWANRVVDAGPESSAALAALEGFEEWAGSHHAHLAPGFDAHDCHCTLSGRDYRTTVFPVVCVAVYDDDALVAVYPHTREDDGIVTVDAGLALLEAGDESTLARLDEPLHVDAGDTDPPTA